jgi:endonuclease-8
MPEGDTIHHAANRIRPILAGGVPDEVVTPHPRFRLDRWPERLGGRAVERVDAHGKHLFLRFEGDLTLHSHLRMGGWWGVFRRGERWRRSPRRAWLVIRTPEHEVVQFDGPVLELMTEGRTRFDQRLAGLGPDILAGEFDEAGALRNLRSEDAERGVGDVLLDQRAVAGIGNVWKAEACFAAGVSPWRRMREVSDDELRSILAAARALMQESVAGRGFLPKERSQVFERAGLPCRRCGAIVRARGQGENNRTTYWCPGCQR